MKRFGKAIAACCALILLPGTSAYAQNAGAGTWTVVGQMAGPRTDIGVTETGGKIYILGGQANGRTDSPMAQEYDPATGKFRDLAPMPKGASHVGVAAMNGKLYVAGGFLANVHKDPQNQAAEYDIATNTWRVLPGISSPRGAVGAAAVGGRLHVIAGRGPDGKTVTTHDVYDLATGKWSLAAPLPVARDHLGVIAYEGKIYVIGGRTDLTVDNTGIADVYDPSTDKWQTLAPMPTKRSSGALMIYKGRLVFVGGECKNPMTRATFDENEAYDPKTNAWTKLANHPTGIHAGGWASVGDTAYFFSGNQGCGGDKPSTAVYAFKLP
jgi:N-acetylneuraminic acid mutarotase